MKVVAISDMHGQLPAPEMFPEAEVLCICGDTFPLRMQSNIPQCVKWFKGRFAEWVDNLPVRHVVMIAGNHDFAFEAFDLHPDRVSDLTDIRILLPKVHYLFDREVEINGVIFYGTPWIPELSNWAYYATPDELTTVFSLIPKGVDVLLTHTPARVGLQGTVLQPNYWNHLRNFGCQQLANRIEELGDIQWALAGHVHSGNHYIEPLGKTSCVNVSYLNEGYEPTYKLFEFEVEPR